MLFLIVQALDYNDREGGEILGDNKQVDRMIHATQNKDRRIWKKFGGKNYNIGAIISLIIIALIWFFAAHAVNSPFIFPYLEDVLYQIVYSLTDMYVLENLGIIMGYSPRLLQWMSPFINSLRQVPIMAWVPLAIVWFGIGDGPTLFLIAFSGVFTIILNTIAGVQDISKDFYNAARSMGAGTLSIIKDIVIPGSLPGVLTGLRLAIGLGWMSVI